MATVLSALAAIAAVSSALVAIPAVLSALAATAADITDTITDATIRHEDARERITPRLHPPRVQRPHHRVSRARSDRVRSLASSCPLACATAFAGGWHIEVITTTDRARRSECAEGERACMQHEPIAGQITGVAHVSNNRVAHVSERHPQLVAPTGLRPKAHHTDPTAGEGAWKSTQPSADHLDVGTCLPGARGAPTHRPLRRRR